MSRLFDMVSGVLPTSETPPPELPEVLDGDNFWEAEEVRAACKVFVIWF